MGRMNGTWGRLSRTAKGKRAKWTSHWSSSIGSRPTAGRAMTSLHSAADTGVVATVPRAQVVAIHVTALARPIVAVRALIGSVINRHAHLRAAAGAADGRFVVEEAPARYPGPAARREHDGVEDGPRT